ncbi:MAG: PhoH family protein [Gammaproteobacteria bacterium]|jgi:PhoH-like ATPase|nr:PhoH family protein [Gammaproteobacteria bacterium]
MIINPHDAQDFSPIESPDQAILYVLDTNVLIHDPTAILNFDEHDIVIPITVLEELDALKSGRQAVAADCRQAIRELDAILGRETPENVESGVNILRGEDKIPCGTLSVFMADLDAEFIRLPTHVSDNKILNDAGYLKHCYPGRRVVLVSKDINIRLKARGCGIESQDYHSDQLLQSIEQLNTGYLELKGSFWDTLDEVESRQEEGRTIHRVSVNTFDHALFPNQFLYDEAGFVAKVIKTDKAFVELLHLDRERLLTREAWGLKARDLHQAFALDLLLDPEIHLVNLTGAAGSGKTILALAAAIEQTVAEKAYRRIIATRSIQGVDEDIGFLPGTEEEKMEPWLGAITDNLEALHMDDEDCHGSIDYVMQKVPLQFKSLNYIRGRSFQGSLILIDESQNLTPHQIKTIVTRAGTGSKVICLGNLAQIDTPYLTPTSSGLTYLTERFKKFERGGSVLLTGVPRSELASFAEAHL